MNILPSNILLSFLIGLIFLTSCGGGSQSLTILPQDCSLSVSKQIGLTLSGEIDPNSQVTWQASLGSIVKNAQGLSATYIAPSVAGEALITATVTSGINASSTVLDVTCHITDASVTAPPQLTTPSTSGEVPPDPGKPPIAISEVMGNTCGGIELRKYNQYVELYNYGDQPVDVQGWYLYDEGDSGTPDTLSAWSVRSNIIFDSQLIFNSTIIPPRSVAVVISPMYADNPIKMPYAFPAGTVILTVAESNTLGDDFFGIIADQDGYDTVTLYIGGASIIDTVVDTYGTPVIVDDYPVEIEDDHRDNIPRYLSECTSIERIDPHLPDVESNWKPVQNGSPGEVPYK